MELAFFYGFLVPFLNHLGFGVRPAFWELLDSSLKGKDLSLLLWGRFPFVMDFQEFKLVVACTSIAMAGEIPQSHEIRVQYSNLAVTGALKSMPAPILQATGIQIRSGIEIQLDHNTVTLSHTLDVLSYGNPHNCKQKSPYQVPKVNSPICHTHYETLVQWWSYWRKKYRKHPKCIVKDNSGAVEITRTSKFHPRTKHLNVKLHRKEISINPISAAEQLADYLTKPVNINILHKLRPTVMGWWPEYRTRKRERQIFP
jgi:hypothetical protein